MIIDGVPGELNMVAPEDIASIDVVKMVQPPLFMEPGVIMALFSSLRRK